MIDRVEELLKELGFQIQLPLHLDNQRSCHLNVNDQLHVRLKVDDSQERILISTSIHELPAGFYRENIFKEALKNNHHYPRTAIFAFSTKLNQLVLFQYLSLIYLNGEKLAHFLEEFILLADKWRVAIANGEPAPTTSYSPSKPLPSPFGIRP